MLKFLFICDFIYLFPSLHQDTSMKSRLKSTNTQLTRELQETRVELAAKNDDKSVLQKKFNVTKHRAEELEERLNKIMSR